jgi:uncharacterized protein YyaL (SSP411 family)
MTDAENMLGRETSPYLLQHAANPVHWRPWGSAALAEAAATGRPVLLSVGYAACHWCHVMAHESFEDAETAALMNRLFVNVKVDREERPDIDQLYMSALHAMGEQGGWPLTMFLAPDGTPFWGGTYFPPVSRWGKPSFRQVLNAIAHAWASERDAITRNAAALRQALAQISATRPGNLPGPDDLDRAALALLDLVDMRQGGLRGAPKFPNPPIFRFLWQNSFRIGDPRASAATHLLLQRMSAGGIYDHLGGGYARYSTDDEWLVPHFEKMLYDNAQLLDLLALAHAQRPDPLYEGRAGETVGWLTRDMEAESRDGVCAFAASEDADSEGEEGRFYVWSAGEIDVLLGADAEFFRAAYDVMPGGNWEGHTILRRVAPPGDDAAEARLARCRAILFAARGRRVRPGRDDKVLADWNGFAIAALCRAGAVFARPGWIRRADAAYRFVMRAMRGPDGRVAHAWRLGRTSAAGLLDDQAAMARAALALFEATGAPDYLNEAIGLAEAAEHFFADGQGAYFLTAADSADVPLGPAARPRSAADNAVPSGNGMMADVLARLFHLTGEARWRERCEALLAAWGGAGNSFAAMPGLLAAADTLMNGASVVIAGAPELPATQALLAAALAAPDPAICVLRAPGAGAAPLPQAHPAHGRLAPAGGAAAFVCRGGVCGLPVGSAEALRNLLDRRGLDTGAP